MRSPQVPGHRRWANRELERDLDRRRSRVNWRLLLGIAIAMLPIAAYLQIQNSYVELNYEVDHLRAEREELERRQHRLLGMRAALEAPVDVERWAHENDLELPTPAEIVVVRRAASGRPDLVAAAPLAEASASGRAARGPRR